MFKLFLSILFASTLATAAQATDFYPLRSDHFDGPSADFYATGLDQKTNTAHILIVTIGYRPTVLSSGKAATYAIADQVVDCRSGKMLLGAIIFYDRTNTPVAMIKDDVGKEYPVVAGTHAAKAVGLVCRNEVAPFYPAVQGSVNDAYLAFVRNHDKGKGVFEL